MPRKKEPYHFLVAGTGPFPLDMLRYDQCHPAAETESGRIEATFRTHGLSSQPIGLKSYAETPPTAARWESFGWRVVATP